MTPAYHTATLLAILEPGDGLFFARRSVFNRIVAIKTWSIYTHVEIYVGGGQVFASLNPRLAVGWPPWRGGGVGIYPIMPHGLALVRRPVAAPNLPAAMRWAREEAVGQPYDVHGLFNFYQAQRLAGERWGMFCSEAATRWWKRAGVIRSENTDADQTSPGMLAWTGELRNVVELDPKREWR